MYLSMYVRITLEKKKTPTLRCAQPRFDRFEIWFYNTDTRYPSSDRNSHSISKTCYWLFLKSAIGFGWAVLLISRFMARHLYRFFRVSNKQAFCGNSNRDWSNGAFVYVSLSTIDTVARKSYWIRYNYLSQSTQVHTLLSSTYATIERKDCSLETLAVEREVFIISHCAN